LPALNFDNFPVLGVGVQNLILAYHEVEVSSEDENMAMASSDGNNADQLEADSEGFHHFNEVEPELAHIHLGRVQTFFSTNESIRKLSRHEFLRGRNAAVG
jgi:hypothetical protein